MSEERLGGVCMGGAEIKFSGKTAGLVNTRYTD